MTHIALCVVRIIIPAILVLVFLVLHVLLRSLIVNKVRVDEYLIPVIQDAYANQLFIRYIPSYYLKIPSYYQTRITVT